MLYELIYLKCMGIEIVIIEHFDFILFNMHKTGRLLFVSCLMQLYWYYWKMDYGCLLQSIMTCDPYQFYDPYR